MLKKEIDLCLFINELKITKYTNIVRRYPIKGFKSILFGIYIQGFRKGFIVPYVEIKGLMITIKFFNDNHDKWVAFHLSNRLYLYSLSNQPETKIGFNPKKLISVWELLEDYLKPCKGVA